MTRIKQQLETMSDPFRSLFLGKLGEKRHVIFEFHNVLIINPISI